MKVKIEMMVEVSCVAGTHKNAEDYEVKSHLCDALSQYEGNDIRFLDCQVKEIICGFGTKFPQNVWRVICLESFDALHVNNIAGERVATTKEFGEGIIYEACSWRPEGLTIDGHFVFNRDANKFAIVK